MASDRATLTPFVPLRHGRVSRAWAPIAVVVGALGLALAARVEIPMVPVPMTLQTYAVLVIGALFGWRLGLGTIGVYLLAAAYDLPVLAGGEGGLDRLTGATAGYLAGFVVAVVLVGWFAERGWTVRFGRSTALMLAGHAVILGLGVTWLGVQHGWRSAVESGLKPFLIGALVKSVLASATLFYLARRSPANIQR